MVRSMGRFFVISIFLFLSGCSQLTNWPTLFPDKAQATDPARYDFSWHLSGDRQVAPLQVFDDGRQMWLQFAANAPVPAIFARNELGDTPLPYERNGPYVVVAGVWPQLVLRGGHLQSVVRRIDDKPSPEQAGVKQPSDINVVGGGDNVGPTVGQSARIRQTSGGVSPGSEALVVDKQRKKDEPERALVPAKLVSETSVTKDNAKSVSSSSQPVPVLESVPMARPAYTVSPKDKNLRLALKRWANTAGWTFGAAHWTVDVDIPVVGSARFDDNFKQAVQALMASTELAARPLQACFYSNKVLRVISYAQSCDRTANKGRAS